MSGIAQYNLIVALSAMGITYCCLHTYNLYRNKKDVRIPHKNLMSK